MNESGAQGIAVESPESLLGEIKLLKERVKDKYAVCKRSYMQIRSCEKLLAEYNVKAESNPKKFSKKIAELEQEYNLAKKEHNALLLKYDAQVSAVLLNYDKLALVSDKDQDKIIRAASKYEAECASLRDALAIGVSVPENESANTYTDAKQSAEPTYKTSFENGRRDMTDTDKSNSFKEEPSYLARRSEECSSVYRTSEEPPRANFSAENNNADRDYHRGRSYAEINIPPQTAYYAPQPAPQMMYYYPAPAPAPAPAPQVNVAPVNLDISGIIESAVSSAMEKFNEVLSEKLSNISVPMPNVTFDNTPSENAKEQKTESENRVGLEDHGIVKELCEKVAEDEKYLSDKLSELISKLKELSDSAAELGAQYIEIAAKQKEAIELQRRINDMQRTTVRELEGVQVNQKVIFQDQMAVAEEQTVVFEQQKAAVERQKSIIETQKNVDSEQGELLSMQSQMDEKHKETIRLQKELINAHQSVITASQKTIELQKALSDKQAEVTRFQKSVISEHKQVARSQKNLNEKYGIADPKPEKAEKVKKDNTENDSKIEPDSKKDGDVSENLSTNIGVLDESDEKTLTSEEALSTESDNENFAVEENSEAVSTSPAEAIAPEVNSEPVSEANSDGEEAVLAI